ncbi:MAG: DUF2855 family protein [Flavobacteriaceae bacterium]
MNLTSDYLIVGSGAIGMAFADVLVEESNATLIIVDKYPAPGGHWNHAYPFVALHQPAAFYGVSSRELSNGKIETDGLNKGFGSLSSLTEIQAYYKAVMEEQFLASGRVQYFPNCEYLGNHRFRHLTTGEEYTVEVKKKLVDASHLTTKVPSTHTPNFSISDPTHFLPINALPQHLNGPAHYCIIGGGKTGMDAIVYLLEQNIPAEKISWVISRDSWVIDRATTQNTEDFFETTIGNQANQFEALAQASSLDDLFDRLEKKGVLMRLDKKVKPTQFHGATVSKGELSLLQSIPTVIRLGRVQEIHGNVMTLDKGQHHCPENTLFVDCSATPIPKDIQNTPIFQDKLIIPQTVRSYQPAFSAAFIAHVELHYPDDKAKNKLCGLVPLPDKDTDWLRGLAATMLNQLNWSSDKPLRQWMTNNRLDGFSKLVRGVDKSDPIKMDILHRMKSNGLPAMMKLQQFMIEIDNKTTAPLSHPQFQVNKKAFFKHELVESPKENRQIEEGQILVKIDQFAYTANNITYAATGDIIRYWEFFPAVGSTSEPMGVIPVWGFADVVESKAEGIPVGDRIYGYFPPTTHLKMTPTKVQEQRFFEGAAHRSSLPMGYNLYRRVHNEVGYSKALDRERSLLFPLYLTSFCLWDSLQDKAWHGAKQIIVLSASSKTSIGLGYALQEDGDAPKSIGITAKRNHATVTALGIWDSVMTYDDLTQLDTAVPTVIVDMSGNNEVLAALHQLLGDNMCFTLKVGLTHWAKTNPKDGIINDRSKFFFAPSHIEKRFKDWGPAVFDEKTNDFLIKAAMKTRQWLYFNELKGIAALAQVHPEVCKGTRDPKEGIIIHV